MMSKRKKLMRKYENRGEMGIFVGYHQDHSHSVYRIFKLESQNVFLTKDITWLGMLYKQWVKEEGGAGLAYFTFEKNNNISAKGPI